MDDKQTDAKRRLIRQMPQTMLQGVAVLALDMDKVRKMTDADLLRIPGCGRKSLAKFRELINEYDRTLRNG